MARPFVKVKERCAERLRKGHLWVFDNEIKGAEGYQNGDIVDVVDGRGRFIGRGYINDRSRIAVRILTFHEEGIDGAFFRRKIEGALRYRDELGISSREAFRVLFSEGDLLPGIIVDRYGDALAVQILTLGIERRKETIFRILMDLLQPATIVERSDVEVRRKEGLEPRKGIVYGKGERLSISTQRIRVEVDLLEGHKTGLYLDQEENREVLKDYVAERRVLDCFSYTGAFALHAALYGAEEVVALEDSGRVIDLLRRNVKINGLERIVKVEKGDAFKWLRERVKRRERFDTIILDPPAFGREAIDGALRGYKDVNLQALKLLKKGGYLITSSCSQAISPERFKGIVEEAAVDAGTILHYLESRFQSRDHPILLPMPETLYLKLMVFRVAHA